MLYIERSRIHNIGAYTLQSFAPGDVVHVFEGTLQPLSNLEKSLLAQNQKKKYKKQPQRSGYSVQITHDVFLDLDEISAAINHSCNPTCDLLDNAVLVARQPIDRYQEITYDYTTMSCDTNILGAPWLLFSQVDVPCQCRTQACPGTYRQTFFYHKRQLAEFKTYFPNE